MPNLTHEVANAIELGVYLAGWYAGSFSESLDSEHEKMLICIHLDEMNFSMVEVPHEREARLSLMQEVPMRLNVKGRNSQMLCVWAR